MDRAEFIFSSFVSVAILTNSVYYNNVKTIFVFCFLSAV